MVLIAVEVDRTTGSNCVPQKVFYSVYCRSANLTIRMYKLYLMSYFLVQTGKTLEKQAVIILLAKSMRMHAWATFALAVLQATRLDDSY